MDKAYQEGRTGGPGLSMLGSTGMKRLGRKERGGGDTGELGNQGPDFSTSARASGGGGRL